MSTVVLEHGVDEVMGEITDSFVSNAYINESDISQRFVLPLLAEYLGYDTSEIIPENRYPVRELYSVAKRVGELKSLTQVPDFVIGV